MAYEGRNMPEIAGVSITAVTAFGCSEDGLHIWVTHKLGSGDEYRLIYRYAAAGQLITLLTQAVRLAYARCAARDPDEAAEGMNSDVMPVAEVRLAMSPENAGAMLHLTTADKIPIAVEIPAALLRELSEQMQQAVKNLPVAPSRMDRLH
jgi:hypothetical protein